MNTVSSSADNRKDRLRACQLEILDETLRIFEALDMPYFAGFGTLLGACRHQGYIPWDDDIDLMMLPQDVMRLIEEAPALLDERFYFQSHMTNVHNIISWMRIGLRNTTSISTHYLDNAGEWGICLDIFPLIPTGSSDSQTNRRMQKKTAEFIRLCHKYDYLLDAKHGNILRRAYSRWQARECDDVNLRKCQELMQELFIEPTDEHTHYLCLDAPSMLYRREIIDVPAGQSYPTCEFEGKTLCAPYDIDGVLTTQYGDWRTPPPVDARVNHTDHDDIILSFDTPWTHYLRMP